MASAFHVSTCGGGIGGLMLALVIGRYGTLPVDIYEAGPTITTSGAGITFYGRTMDVMKDLGLYDELVKIAIGPPRENTGPNFRKSDQRDGYQWFSRNLRRGPITFHRKDLVDFLLRKISPSCQIHTSKRLRSYDTDSRTGKIILHFSDGSSAITDVLVGADGIHSVTRKTMYQKFASLTGDDDSSKRLLECIDPVWTGTLVYRNLVPTAKYLKEYPDIKTLTDQIVHLGKDKHMIIYPISHGKLLNVGIYCQYHDAFGTPFKGRWVTDVSEKEIMDQFEGWEDRARALVKCIEKPSRWALHILRPLPHYVDGRAALLGDAAHAMEPYFGAGAGQAVEDSFVLGRLLTHELTHLENVAEALKTYEEIRLPFANGIVQRAQNIGHSYALRRASADGSVPSNGSPEELDYVRKSIEDAWEWQNEPSRRAWDEAEECWRAKCSAYVKPLSPPQPEDTGTSSCK